MPIVTTDVRQLSGDDSLVTPDSGAVWFTPYRAYHVEEGGDDYLVSTEVLRRRLVDGVDATELPESPVDNLMKVELRGVKGYGGQWFVSIPAGDCYLFDLEHIDPETLDPIAPPTPYWREEFDAEVEAREQGDTDRYTKTASDARYATTAQGAKADAAQVAADLDDDTAALVPGETALGEAVADKIEDVANRGNVATRIFGGRMGSYVAGGLTTFQITTEVQGHFDAVRPIFATTESGISRAARAVGVSVISSTTDLNNSSGTWTGGLKGGGLTRISPAVAPTASERVSYYTTDWINVGSIPRSDAGTKPLVVLRAVFSSGTIPVYGNGTDDFTNWATRSDGRKWAARAQPVEGVNTPGNFTSTTNISQSPIVGVQYLHRGNVVTVMGVGDSITEGRGTYLGEGLVMPAVEELSADLAADGVAVEYANLGWSGQSMASFAERAIDALESDLIRPDVLVLPAGSPNDPATAPITAAHVAIWRSRRARVQAAARAAGVPLVTFTILPVNTAVNNWGTSDSFRRDYNTEVLALATEGLLVADASTAVAGATSGGQVQLDPAYEDDGIHPNTAGNAVLATLILPFLREAIARLGGNKPPTSARASEPIHMVTDTDAHVTEAGTWVYATSSADGAWTMLSPLVARPDSQVYNIHVRDTARKLVLTPTAGFNFFWGHTSLGALTILPGQSVRLTPAGTAWSVEWLSPPNVAAYQESAASSATLRGDRELFVATGTTSTLTLPALISNRGVRFTIKNRGSGAVTLTRAGADQIHDGTTAQTSITVAAGATARVIGCDTYWETI